MSKTTKYALVGLALFMAVNAPEALSRLISSAFDLALLVAQGLTDVATGL